MHVWYTVAWYGLGSAQDGRQWEKLLQEYGVAILREEMENGYEESVYGRMLLSRSLKEEELSSLREYCHSIEPEEESSQ